MGAQMDIVAPVEQEGTKAVVRKWLKAVGDTVVLNEPLVELETDKVTVEVAAESDGVLAEILALEGVAAEPGAVLGRLSAAGAKPGPKAAARVEIGAEPAVAAAWTSSPRSIASFDPDLRLSPAVRRRLIEAELDPVGLKGTGRDGRLTREDVDLAIAARAERPAPPPARPAPLAPAFAGGIQSIPHDSMRRRIAEHMVHSMTVAPHVTSVFEADFTAVSAHRAAHKAAFEKKGVALTYTAYIVAAAAEAMRAAPQVNSRWFDDRLEVYQDVNIGVGTALGEKGLIVPVIAKAQSLSLLGIAERLQDMTRRARSNKLTPADMRDGTFSISNHGVSGSLFAAPIIINQPQSAILGVGKLEKRVVVRTLAGQDALLVRPMAYVSLTIDHRVIDAHQTNAWLSRFVEVLEGWET